MTDYADLEIELRRHPTSGYEVDLRYSQPNSDADIRLTRRVGDAPSIEFDRERLRELLTDPTAYGRLLGDTLLSDAEVRAAFEKAYASTQSLNASLRVRLLIDPSAAELHSLHWETLRNPHDGAALFTGENVTFSRYLSSFDWRPVRLRPQSELKALVVVANPIGLDKFNLPPADVAQELAHVQNNLGNIKSTALASGGSANLNHIITNLHDGYDILYVICHGTTQKGDTWLWLEDEAGNVARTSGTDIVARLNELQQRPRLMVLAACQGAGQGDQVRTDENPLTALGPRLAEAGIPAVIAMQGTVSVETVGDFMPVFFRELQRDGHIDRAMAVARGAVRDRPDYWMPTLFMRLKSGRIWYVPGFGDDRKDFEKWPTLVSSIRDRKCTPILGPGLHESLLGSTRDIARHWAETYRFPLEPHQREDLPQVTQFLSTNQNKNFPRTELGKYLIREIRERYADDLPADLREDNAEADDLFGSLRSDDELLGELISTVGKKRRQTNENDPYKILARLPFPLYITTSPDNLLVDALKEAGREPQIEVCPWNDDIEQEKSLEKSRSDYSPTAKQPLVYYLFGRLNQPKSLVITEDDYFDYLIGVTRNKELIPTAVRRSLADTALLFLGFQLEDWNFRVVYRSIIGQQGGARRNGYAHIAGQIEPEEGRLLEPDRARNYLEKYFFQDAEISLYWGSPEEFLADLMQKAKAKPGA
jgi:hypothetical protein